LQSHGFDSFSLPSFPGTISITMFTAPPDTILYPRPILKAVDGGAESEEPAATLMKSRSCVSLQSRSLLGIFKDKCEHEDGAEEVEGKGKEIAS
jgi:hypothetical protein